VKIKRSAVTQTVIGSPGIYDRRRDAFFMARGLPGWQRPQVLAELRRAFGDDMWWRTTSTSPRWQNATSARARSEELRLRYRRTGIGLGLIIDGNCIAAHTVERARLLS